MTDPERLLEAGSDVERALLGSAARDRGSERAAKSAAAVVVATLATAKASAATLGAKSAILILKWAVVGAVAGLTSVVAVNAGASFVAERRVAERRVETAQETRPPRQRAANTSSPKPRQPASNDGARVAGSLPPPTNELAESAASAPVSRTKASAAAALSANTRNSAQGVPGANVRRYASSAALAHAKVGAAHADDSAALPATTAPKPIAAANEHGALADELALLDSARHSLAMHDPRAALDAVDRHDQLFGSGALGPEALILRVEALLSLGDRASAERVSRAFLERHASGPHVARIRALLAR